jgi:hypothetical protein
MELFSLIVCSVFALHLVGCATHVIGHASCVMRQYPCVVQHLLLCKISSKCENIKIRKGIFCQDILLLEKKIKILFLEIFLPHLDFAFSLVKKFKQVFKLLRKVLKTSHQLMLNPSWDPSQ